MKDWPWHYYLIIAVVVCGLLYLGLFKPKNKQLKSLKEQRIKVEDNVKRLRTKKKELDKIEAELVILNRTLQELEAIIPERKETGEILKKMQQLALNSRLNIVKFNPKTEITKQFFYEWPISLEITGNYHNLATFFDRLSRSPRLYTIENFSIKSLGRQTEDATLAASYTAKTYVFREEEPEKVEKKVKKKKRR